MLFLTFLVVFMPLMHYIACPSPPSKLAKCSYDIGLLWSKEVGHAPFAAAPVIADVDADGQLDVIAAPFTDVLTVLSGKDGHVLPSTSWPQKIMDTSVHASPLLYDINRDGLDDILLVTSDGELHFYNHDGKLIDLSYKIPPVLLDRSWYETWVSWEATPVSSFIHTSLAKQPPSTHISVDPHVLATPVIADLNGDGILEEMVIPVSYYFNQEKYGHAASLEESDLSASDLHNYLVGSVVIFNLTSMQPTHTAHLELAKTTWKHAGYMLSSPTVIDLDSDASHLEIVVGTAAGRIHVLQADGTQCAGYPQEKGPLQGQILVADISGDGRLDVVTLNSSGVVFCFNTAGQLQWFTPASGSTTAGFRAADIDGDGQLEVVFGTNDGNVWALEGKTGAVLTDWPYRVTHSLTSMPLITRLDNHMQLDVGILADNNHLHIIRGDTKCRHTYKIGEMTYVPALSHDLVPNAPGLETLVATKDGMVLCLGRKPQLNSERSLQYIALEGMGAEYKTHNGFTHYDAQAGIFIHREDNIVDVTGSWMTLTFDIIDYPEQLLDVEKSYRVSVYIGSILRAGSTYSEPGSYSLHVATPDAPARAHLKVTLTNRHGQVFTDKVAVRFNMLFLDDLQWLLACPFVAMAIMLLFLHGYPAADLLPMTRSKDI